MKSITNLMDRRQPSSRRSHAVSALCVAPAPAGEIRRRDERV